MPPVIVQPLPYFNTALHSCYIAREDEHGGVLNGSKYRKYAGLFDYLNSLKPSCVIIPGSIASNHVIASASLCKQWGLKCLVITSKSSDPVHGNASLLLKLLNDEQLLYAQDPFLEALRVHEKTPGSFLMPLGGYHPQAAQSALSLGSGLMEFHQRVPLSQIFLDAGTGLSAASALLQMQAQGYQGKAYVIKMGKLNFSEVLAQTSQWVNLEMPRFSFEVLPPVLGKYYGKSDPVLDRFALEFYQHTGILLDPFYNAKLFYTASRLIQETASKGTTLIVHSGGTLSGYVALDQSRATLHSASTSG